MKVIIMAWWTGTRLRPVSTKAKPKQFLKIDWEKSMLQMTFERVLPLVDSTNDILISSNDAYVQLILDDLHMHDITRDNIITEPSKKNTWPALGLAMSYLKDNCGCNEDEVVLSVHADQIITPNQTFIAYVKGAQEYAQKWYIVTFGINPTKPETWYWYIQVDMEHVGDFGQPIQQFVEKPDLETAKQYVSSWNYYRNSGTFMFPLWVTINEINKLTPSLWKHISSWYDAFYANYDKVESIAIDVALMEKTDKWYVVPMHLQWSDVWSWDSMYDISIKDEQNNVLLGDVKVNDVSSSIVRSTNTPIKLNGVDNIVVIEDESGIYISTRGQSQWIKKLLE